MIAQLSAIESLSIGVLGLLKLNAERIGMSGDEWVVGPSDLFTNFREACEASYGYMLDNIYWQAFFAKIAELWPQVRDNQSPFPGETLAMCQCLRWRKCAGDWMTTAVNPIEGYDRVASLVHDFRHHLRRAFSGVIHWTYKSGGYAFPLRNLFDGNMKDFVIALSLWYPHIARSYANLYDFEHNENAAEHYRLPYDSDSDDDDGNQDAASDNSSHIYGELLPLDDVGDSSQLNVAPVLVVGQSLFTPPASGPPDVNNDSAAAAVNDNMTESEDEVDYPGGALIDREGHFEDEDGRIWDMDGTLLYPRPPNN